MNMGSFKQTVLPPAERGRVLDRLDQGERGGPKHPRRAAPRVQYRVTDIPFTVNHPGGGVGRYIVIGRNLSTGGMSLLNAGFVHPGSACKLMLTLADQRAKALMGTVVFCRHVAGNIHEVGVRFNEKIDLAEFALENAAKMCDDEELRELMKPLSGAALLVVPGATQKRVLTACLNETGLDVTAVDSAGACIDQIRLLPYLLAMCDMGLPEPGLGSLIVGMRGAGFAGPVVGTADAEDQAKVALAAELGLDGFVGQPVRREDMQVALRRALKARSTAALASAPIFSSLPPDQGAEPLIRNFVSHAHAVAGTIDQALRAGQAGAVRRECEGLKAIAGGYGFLGVAEAARQAVAALDSNATLAAASPKIHALLSMCSRLRSGRSETRAA